VRTTLLALKLVLDRDEARRLLFGQFETIFRRARAAHAAGRLSEADLHRLAFEEMVEVLDRDEDAALRFAAEAAVSVVDAHEFFGRRTLRRQRQLSQLQWAWRLEARPLAPEGERNVGDLVDFLAKAGEVDAEAFGLSRDFDQGEAADLRHGERCLNVEGEAPGQGVFEAHDDLNQGLMDVAAAERFHRPVKDADHRRPELRSAVRKHHVVSFIRHSNCSPLGLDAHREARLAAGGTCPSAGGEAPHPEHRP